MSGQGASLVTKFVKSRSAAVATAEIKPCQERIFLQRDKLFLRDTAKSEKS